MNQKQCPSCGVTKLYFDFAKNRSTYDGYQTYCRDCTAQRRKTDRAKGVDLVSEYKLRMGCTDCGYAEHACALDFDHLPEYDKKFTISDELHRSLQQIQEEMAKCEVVCANCHRVRTKRRLDEL